MVKRKAADQSGEIPSNVSDEVRQDFYKKALRAKQTAEEAAEIYKSANADYRLVLKTAKNAGVSPEAIAYALSVRNMDREVLYQTERDKARMLALSGLWPSIQEDFFNLLTPIDQTNEITVEVAFDNGHTCGLKGENRDINPHPPATEKWDAWDRGWLQGQGTNVEKITPKGARKGSRKALQEAMAATEVPTGIEDEPAEPLFTDA